LGKKKISSPTGLVNELLRIRGIKEKKDRDIFLNPLSPDEITSVQAGISKRGLDKAAKRIATAIEKKEGILVYGDYDADGLCGTAIIWETVYQLKGRVLPFIPDREKDGYGLNPESLKRLVKKLPDLSLIITVDNGIVAHDGIELAQSKGIDVIVVDHHLKGSKPLLAAAVVHTPHLSGSGVAWFLARHLGEGKLGLPDLGLAALGTIADMMPATKINRSMIKFGVPHLEKTRRVGLRHLFRQAGIENRPIDVQKVGFIIAPRINALGRIANPLDGLRLLCVRKVGKGEELARLAQKVNVERQQLTEAGIALAKSKLKVKKIPKIIIVSDSSFHQGIIGLIASRLMNEFYRPVVVIKKEKKISRGSARSIKGLNILDALREVESTLIDLGGHKMAAGFELKTKDLSLFEKRLSRVVGRKLKGKNLIPSIRIDSCLKPGQLTREYCQAISDLSPFGIGNPEPVFLVTGLRVTEARGVGADGKHLKLFLDDPKTLAKERITAEAIGFGLGSWRDKILPGDLVDLVFCLELNYWNGRSRVVLNVKDLKITGKVIE